MTDLISAQIGGEDLRRFHGQLHRGLLMHRRGRLNLFFQLQFPQSLRSDAFAVEIASQLDLTQWFADAAPAEIAHHPSYEDMLDALTVVMGAANFAIDNAQQRINPEQFSSLI